MSLCNARYAEPFIMTDTDSQDLLSTVAPLMPTALPGGLPNIRPDSDSVTCDRDETHNIKNNKMA